MEFFNRAEIVLLFGALAACQAAPAPISNGGNLPAETPQEETPVAAAPAPAKINDRPTLEKLLGNSGIALQWISWEPKERGKLTVTVEDGVVFLYGEQDLGNGTGSLKIDGHVSQVDKDSFDFVGNIVIKDAPDQGRYCVKLNKSHFAITQNRKYFRMREFEWCDGLTDYIDIYF